MILRFLVCAFLSLTALVAQTPPNFAVVSAASFARDGALAPEMIATGFAAAITDTTGYTVLVRDSAGPERNAQIVAAARGQVSFVVPAGTAVGNATITLRNSTGVLASGPARVARVAPGLFTANSTGDGAPAGFVLTAHRSGSRDLAELFESFPGQTHLEPRPFDSGAQDAEVYLMLFGTGIRGAALSAVSATIAGQPVPVQAAQAQGGFAGLDQVNLGPLPGTFANRLGLAELAVTVDGVPANKLLLAPTLPPSGGWGTRANLIEANSEMGIAELNGKIYVIGGYPSSRVTVATVQSYDTATDRWSLVAPLPTPVNHLMPVTFNNKLYVIGGQTDANVAYTNIVQEYDPATNTWRRLANMPTARSSGAAVVIEGRIYVAGGRPPRGADFAVYDPATDTWTALPDLPTQRNHLIAAAHGGKMFVIGGRFEGGFQSQQADAVEIYDPRTNSWSRGASLPKPRGGLNGVEALGCIHTFGGEFATGVHPDHDVYNPVTNTWLSLDPLPIPVHGVTGAAFVNGLIYLPGGGTSQGGTTGSRHHQVYRPNFSCR